MNSLLLLVASATLGIDTGWQPAPDGSLEYIIQIQPELLDQVSKEGFTSEIPAELKNVQRFRIVVGEAKLPRELPAKSGTLFDPDRINKADKSADASDKPRLPGGKTFSEEPEDGDDAQAHTVGFKNSNDRNSSSIKSDKLTATSAGDAPKPVDPDRPWLPLIAALIALFASLGANVYLGWLNWGTRNRYRELLSQVRDRPATV